MKTPWSDETLLSRCVMAALFQVEERTVERWQVSGGSLKVDETLPVGEVLSWAVETQRTPGKTGIAAAVKVWLDEGNEKGEVSMTVLSREELLGAVSESHKKKMAADAELADQAAQYLEDEVGTVTALGGLLGLRYAPALTLASKGTAHRAGSKGSADKVTASHKAAVQAEAKFLSAVVSAWDGGIRVAALVEGTGMNRRSIANLLASQE